MRILRYSLVAGLLSVSKLSLTVAHSQVARGRDGLQTRRVAENILKQAVADNRQYVIPN